MRHLSRRDGPPALRMGVNAAGELVVATEVPGRQDAGQLAELVRTADTEGVAVRFAPGRDLVLAAELIELGFEWREGASGRYLMRMPAEITFRPGR